MKYAFALLLASFMLRAGVAGAAEPKDLLTSIAASKCCTIFIGAIRSAGLEQMFRDTSKSYTVLVPNDEAFAKIPELERDAMLRDKQYLRALILAHTTPGKIIRQEAASNGAFLELGSVAMWVHYAPMPSPHR